MYAEERQQAIASEVRARGRVAVTQLAQRFEVTGETVRRDLAVLARQGVVQRVHGGAVRPDIVAVIDEPDLAQREQSRLAEKTAIGRAAQAFLPPAGGSVIFDAGTTTLRAALALAGDRDLAVITNALPLATHLSTLPRCEVTVVGGRIRGKTQAAVGATTVDTLRRMRASVAFMGVNGLSLDHGLSTPDPDEAAAKRAMLSAANTVVVLADSSKFNREDLVSFGDLTDIDVLVTDAEADPSLMADLTALDIEVVIA
ncbi:putative DeoR family transcriptional regulator [Gordonia hirsuta DSM 44140 = NBRC 16056]|uniref:Lactose phosphotransferase system repressor n=1 Tax=Gordonia hirsuta DSM 44140 = NBRC 16056 TaxID=1121927 RepID=L7LC41_9ACTN|nr:DeoR/GlpR family DNA-binding transcription regulator [Gordonia hirsuta]GAC58316.1 putative DeoR family transcriptional regulator [Gordonia hirsuta DSM 44140 = NBRC 16056]